MTNSITSKLWRASIGGFLLLAIWLLSGCATSSLNRAITDNDHDRAMELVREGKGLDEKDAAGKTPLHNAIWKGDSRLVAALLERGVDVNARTKDNRTPLIVAASSSHLDVDIVKDLIGHGANPNLQDNAGVTPLISAAGQQYDPTKSSRHVEIVEQLLRANADTNIEDKIGKTALHYAAYRGRPVRVVELVLANGGNVHHRVPPDGISPLMEAAANGQREAFDVLAATGATPHITVNKELAEQSENNRLEVNLSFENNGRAYSMYGDWLCDRERSAESQAYYLTAIEQLESAAKEFNRASVAYREEIPKAKAENAGRVAGSILGSLIGLALAAGTGTGFYMTPNLTNLPEVYAENTKKYAEKASECKKLAERAKNPTSNK